MQFEQPSLLGQAPGRIWLFGFDRTCPSTSEVLALRAVLSGFPCTVYHATSGPLGGSELLASTAGLIQLPTAEYLIPGFSQGAQLLGLQ